MRYARPLCTIVLLAGLILSLTSCSQESSMEGYSSGQPSGSSGNENLRSARVVRVVDGDTLVVDMNGVQDKVRLIGIDTPETKKSPGGAEAYGEDASAYTHQRLDGKTVELEMDQEERDKHGRILAYVWVDGGLYNEEIAREGWAKAKAYPPNTRYKDRLESAQSEAKDARRGIWQ